MRNFMSTSLKRNLMARDKVVLYLYAAGLAHCLVGLILTWAGGLGWFDGYLGLVELRFWGTELAPAPARTQQIWWLALFGATLQSYSVYMLALVHIGNRLKTPLAWGSLMAGLVLWAPQDMLLSAQKAMWLHVWLDGLALFLLLPPLIWLYGHDRRFSYSNNIK
jgi:hypothetical protein